MEVPFPLLTLFWLWFSFIRMMVLEGIENQGIQINRVTCLSNMFVPIYSVLVNFFFTLFFAECINSIFFAIFWFLSIFQMPCFIYPILIELTLNKNSEYFLPSLSFSWTPCVPYLCSNKEHLAGAASNLPLTNLQENCNVPRNLVSRIFIWGV